MDFISNYVDDIKNELTNERNKNQKLVEDLNTEKAKNEQLTKELKLEREKYQKLNDSYQDLVNPKIKIIDELNSKIQSLELILKETNKELNNLKQNINNPKSLIDNQIENIMVIAFTTVDRKFIYPLICKNTDKFNTLEMKLYEKYPQYTEENYNFTVDGKEIKKYKTLEENGIKCSDLILLNVSE